MVIPKKQLFAWNNAYQYILPFLYK